MEYSLNSFDLLGPSVNLEPPWPRSAPLRALAATLEIVRSEALPLPWTAAEAPTAILPEPGRADGPPAIPGHLRTVRPRTIAVSRAASVLFLPEPEPDAIRPYEDHESAWFGDQQAETPSDTLPWWAVGATVLALGGMFLGLVSLFALT